MPIETGLATIGPPSLLSDGTVVLWGRLKGQKKAKLKQYNPHTGVLLNCDDVKYTFLGVAEVKVDGRSALVLGYRYIVNICVQLLHIEILYRKYKVKNSLK